MVQAVDEDALRHVSAPARLALHTKRGWRDFNMNLIF